MNRCSFSLRVVLLAFAAFLSASPASAADAPKKPAEPANAVVSIWTQNVTQFRKDHGAVGGYTKKWDLSALPRYAPKQKLTGTLRFWGNNYIKDGYLAEYWEAEFKKFHPDLTIAWNLPTTGIAIPALSAGVADLVMSSKAILMDLLTFEQVYHHPITEIAAVTGSYDVYGWSPAFIIVVHKDNPLTQISMKQLDGVFGGARTGGYVGSVWHTEYPYARDLPRPHLSARAQHLHLPEPPAGHGGRAEAPRVPALHPQPRGPADRRRRQRLSGAAGGVRPRRAGETRLTAGLSPHSFSSPPDMNTSTASAPGADFSARLRPALPGMLFAVLTLLFGFGLGIVFGVNEDAVKSALKASAVAGKDTVYRGDDAAIKNVLDRAWVYMQRAHLHAGGIGTAAVGLILLVVALGTSAGWTRAISLALGLGGLGYSVYWMWAGFRAPVLGGTTPAKESLKWLAMPTSGAVLLATIAVAVLVVGAILRTRREAATSGGV